MKIASLLATALFCLPMATSAATITGYNMSSALKSGAGMWSNTYSGTITPTGNSATIYPHFGTFTLNDLTGAGSGTLNDGILGTGVGNTHLLSSADNVVIELFFDATYFLSSINLFSFASGNAIPGSMTGFDASWSGGSASFTTTQNGAKTETASFAGSGLDGVAVSSLTLSNFKTAGNQYFDLYGISEITFTSTLAAVPLPASGLLLLAGAGGLAGLRRRKKAT
jgi:hypothetical protein